MMTERKRNSLTKKILWGLATATLCVGFSPVYADAPAATALPTNGTVDSGTAAITQSTDTTAGTATMNITQSTPKAIINWGTFNIGAKGTVNFIQPDVSAITLNRVAANGGMSVIAGNINANGSIILINPNGMLFSQGSVVNAAGIIASTANITDANFNAGNIIFEQNKDQNANITMNGTINAETNGGYITGAMTDSVKNSYKAGLSGTDAEKKTQLDTVLNTLTITPATGFSVANNKIMLVADGDITVGAVGSLQAVTTTSISSNKTLGSEGFTAEGSSSTREGSIVLRADQNADDVADVDTSSQAYTAGSITTYNSTSNGGQVKAGETFKTAKVYLLNTKASQIASRYVSVYYDPNITSLGINGTAANSIGIYNSAQSNFTQKDYTPYGDEATAYKDKIADSFTGNKNDTTGKNSTFADTTKQQNVYMLVNNVYQLEAIQDTAAVDAAEHSGTAAKGTNAVYYGNLGGGYAQGTTFEAADTVHWEDAQGLMPTGFNPIGYSKDVPFTGAFTGNGGSNTYKIDDLNILRPGSDYVGLFANMQGAWVGSTSIVDSVIQGQNYVGGIAGHMTNSTIESSTTRKRTGEASDGGPTQTPGADNVNGSKDYVGGLVGAMDGTSTIKWYSSNQSKVTGVNYVGGLAGKMEDTSQILDSRNIGNNGTDITDGVGVITGTDYVGGLVGYMSTDVADTTGKSATTGQITVSNGRASTYNSGSVTGVQDVGGLVGHMTKGEIRQAYNTNERSTLGTAATGSVITTDAIGAGTSPYGKVTGTGDNVGGLVGDMETGTILTAYNAGDVTSTGNNVGGLVGNMKAGTISKAYNADNNTILYTSGNDTSKYYGFTSGGKSYTYDMSNKVWKQDGTTISFSDMATAAQESTRTYYNRLAYRDAVIHGKENVGGLVGNMAGGSIGQAYNAGKVTSSNASSTTLGAVAGNVASGAVIGNTDTTKVFYATANNANQAISGAANGIGTNGATTKAVTNAVMLDNLQQAATLAWNDGTTSLGTTNQNNDWIVYSHQSTPLLKAFMSWINIKREYQYDGTVHNLMTTDVDNYYGGAFFDEAKGLGKNVHTDGVDNVGDTEYKGNTWVDPNAGKTNASNHDVSNSSLYKYEASYMWSPQHGYYTDPTAEMVVTPAPLTVTLTGSKTYGENAVKGAAGTTGQYTSEIAGYKNGETALTALTGTLENVKYTDDDNKLSAKSYTLTDKVTGSTLAANNSNYKISYTGSLDVNKAVLNVNLVGEKTYGEANSTGTYTYTATVGGSGTDAANSGNLKSWDTGLATGTIDGNKISGLTANVNVTQHNRQATNSGAITEATDVTGTTEGTTFTVGQYTLSNATFASDILANYNIKLNTSGTNTMKIDPRSVTYTIAGSNTYGQTNYAYEAKGVSGLATGDTADSVLRTNSTTAGAALDVTAIGDASRQAAVVNGTTGIDEKTHVARTSTGAVTTVFDGALQLGNTTLNVAADNHNYAAVSTQFQYTVNPAAITYNVADNTKVYGNTALDKANSGSFSGYVNNDAAAGFYSGTKANVTTATYGTDSTVQALNNVGVMVANAAVKRTTTDETAGKYDNVIMASGLYLNDYDVSYGKGGVTITPKELTIQAGSGSKTYGDENTSIQYKAANFTGLITSDSGLNSSDNYTSSLKNGSVIGQYSDAGTYTGETAVALKNNTTYKNYQVTLQNGDLSIDQRGVTYVVDNKTREYGADNPAFTGTLTGVLEHDAGRIPSTLPQSAFVTTTTAGSNVGTYTGDIDVQLGSVLSKNYKVNNVTKGTLTITQGLFYYKATPSSYTQGDTKIDTDTQHGTIVNGMGKDVTAFLTDADKNGYVFSKESTTTSASPVGQYAIYGSGIMTDANYKMVPAGTNHGDQVFGNATALHIQAQPTVPSINETTAYKAAILPPAPGNKFAQDTANRISGKDGVGMIVTPDDAAATPSQATAATAANAADTTAAANAADGGHIPKEARSQIRFLTVESTGINLDVASTTNNTVTIDASSRVDGGATTTVSGQTNEGLSVSETPVSGEAAQTAGSNLLGATAENTTISQAAGVPTAENMTTAAPSDGSAADTTATVNPASAGAAVPDTAGMENGNSPAAETSAVAENGAPTAETAPADANAAPGANAPAAANAVVGDTTTTGHTTSALPANGTAPAAATEAGSQGQPENTAADAAGTNGTETAAANPEASSEQVAAGNENANAANQDEDNEKRRRTQQQQA